MFGQIFSNNQAYLPELFFVFFKFPHTVLCFFSGLQFFLFGCALVVAETIVLTDFVFLAFFPGFHGKSEFNWLIYKFEHIGLGRIKQVFRSPFGYKNKPIRVFVNRIH